MRFLPRWSVATAIALVALIAAFVIALDERGAPGRQAELEMALEHATHFRIAIAFDFLVWVGFGGFVWDWECSFYPARRLEACSCSRAVSLRHCVWAGAMLRLTGTLELADRYERAEPARREEVLRDHVDL